MKLDIIGDVHGCSVELEKLVLELGYINDADQDGRDKWFHPKQRRLAFLGDVVDRGYDSFGALLLVKDLIDSGVAFIGAVGNHDYKMYRGVILGKPIKVFYGQKITLDQVRDLGVEKEFAEALEHVFSDRPPFTVFEKEKLLIVHAALCPEMLRADYSSDWTDENSQFALYGEAIHIDGEPFPRKGYLWADSWDSDWTVIYGHDVIGEMPIIRGANSNVIGIDTGASYGGRLTALRWPEKEFVAVAAKEGYPEHEKDFPDDAPLSVFNYSWDEVAGFSHKNTNTLHYLHGKRKTPEMSVPKNIKF